MDSFHFAEQCYQIIMNMYNKYGNINKKNMYTYCVDKVKVKDHFVI